MDKQKVDWLIIEQDYLSNRTLSLKDISKKYSVSHSQLKKISMKMVWNKRRKALLERGKKQIEADVGKSILEQIKEHKKDAIYVKNTALAEIRKRAENGHLQGESLAVLVRMLDIGLRELREMFPTDLPQEEIIKKPVGMSKALDEAIHEVFIRKLIERKPLTSEVSNQTEEI